ncbi:MAG: SMC-Scp complex subunit ScpB [Pseudomonadota bacterium]
MEPLNKTPEKLKQIVEAALLAAHEPVTLDQLVKLFKASEIDKDTIRADLREALKALETEAENRGYELARVASGFRYQVRQELSTWVSRLWEEKPPRYTRALLETLALVAYKQPVTRGDIEQVRGVSVSQNIMRTLLERGWIRVVGQREVPGRPAMYGTTKEFLDYFNLKSLDQLPPLAEIRELIEPVIVEEAAASLEAGQETDPADAADQIQAAEEAADAEQASVAEPAADAEQPDAGEGDPATAAEQDEGEAGTDTAGARLAAEVAESLEDDDVDIDSDAFDEEIAAALAAADAASERFNNPTGPDTEADVAADADSEADGQPAAAAEEAAAAGAEDAAERPAQVVDVVTDLEGAEPSADASSETSEADEQPRAEVVQLPRPH